MSKAPKMDHVFVYVPREYLGWLDQLVGEGKYPSRSEAIRTAIRDLLRSESVWRARASDSLLSRVASAGAEG